MSDILYSGQAPCQSCGDTMPIGDLIKGRCLACLELEERGQARVHDTSKILPRRLQESKMRVDGWTVKYRQLQEISDKAKMIDDVSLEQAEAIILAMIDLRYIEFGDDHETE